MGQALVYRPVNPAFGGNNFNYQWMIGSAQAQDKLKDPNAPVSQSGLNRQQQSPLDNFTQSINQQLLSRISRQILDRQFGEEGLQEGDFEIGNFRISIRNATDGIQIRIFDGKGGETTITVPYF
jgi:curli production assembly/transport component CsgF